VVMVAGVEDVCPMFPCFLAHLLSLSLSLSLSVAIAYWLRDLEMEEYTLVFASQLGVNFIESLPLLTTHKIESLVKDPAHR
jgi:hypothetical protein